MFDHAVPHAPRRSGYELVVGLEVHLALNTQTKLFCSCPNHAGHTPNEHVCPVCAGLPGALPRPNAEALTLAVRFAAALGCSLPEVTTFARKHYGYPDAPKNYQLSQHDRPVGLGGALELPDGRRVGITRCHLEEDAGRLVHPAYADHSWVDLGRAGAPLIELVSDPVIRSGEEARAFLEEVRALARALGVSDATPEEGRMRADVNISMRRPGEPLGTKVEVKNLNSFKSAQAAIESEAVRQERILAAGGSVRQETRGWNEGGQKSMVMRVKEGAADYRYLDDPDLPPIKLSAGWLAEVLAATPATPAELRRRYQKHGLRPEDADRLASDIDAAHAFDALQAAAEAQARTDAGARVGARSLANWLLSDVIAAAHSAARPLSSFHLADPEPAARLVRLVALVESNRINALSAKGLLAEVLAGADAEALMRERNLEQVSDDGALASWVDAVLAEHPDVAAQAAENPKAINFLMGQVMQRSAGRSRPDAVRTLLRERLGIAP